MLWVTSFHFSFQLVAWTLSLLSLTSVYVLCKKLAEVFGYARWEFRALLDLHLGTCLLFTHGEEKVHDWGVVHVFCVSQCVKSRWIVVYFNIMNECILGSILLRNCSNTSFQGRNELKLLR